MLSEAATRTVMDAHRMHQEAHRAHPLAGIDRRRAKRVTFDPPLRGRYLAIDGTSGCDCLVIDTSASGAQLEFAVPVGFHEFFLVLSAAARPVNRRCRVIWSNGNRVGVEFQ